MKKERFDKFSKPSIFDSMELVSQEDKQKYYKRQCTDGRIEIKMFIWQVIIVIIITTVIWWVS